MSDYLSDPCVGIRQKLEKKIAAMREVLQIVEWDDCDECPLCECGTKASGHDEDCPIAKVLK